MDTERRAAVLDAVQGLPDPQRDVIVLRFYSDLSLEEIAAVTRRPVGTVKSRLHRGLDGLRHQLGVRTTL